MTEWEPATDAEIAMRNALRTDDQESYFRILAGVDLLLPVSADALAGLAPLGWGTWSTGGRTHVLAFTSPSALQACLADYTGSARRVAYAELADTWPNLEWWLAVNPGLPIEGYLPAWFVAQLSRGDLRLPTRGPGREGSNAPNRIQDLHAAATLAATAAAQGYNAAAQNYAAPASGGPITGNPAPSSAPSGGPGSGSPAYSGAAGASAYDRRGADGGPDAAVDSAYRRPGSGSPSAAGPGSGGPARGGAGSAAQAYAGSGGPAYGSTSPGGDGGSPGGAAFGAGANPAGSAYAAAGPGVTSGAGAAPADGGQVGPGGLPLRTPGAVLPSGLPSRVPGAPAGAGGSIPGGQFNGFGTRPGPQPDGPGGQPADRAPGDLQSRPGAPTTQPGGPQGQPGGPQGQPGGAQGQPVGLQGQPGAPTTQPGGLQGQPGGPQSQGQPGGLQSQGQPGGLQSQGQAGGLRPGAGEVPAAYRPPTLPGREAAGPGAPARSGPSALSALGSRSPGSVSERATPPPSTPPASPPSPLQRPDAPLPTRTPMAQTPPLPAHIPPPSDTGAADTDDDAASAGASATGASATGASSAEPAGESSTASGGLPRRQVTSPEERPSSMAAAAQALAANRSPGATQPQSPAQEPDAPQKPGLAPPVIPGAAGAGRGTTPPIVPAGATRPTIPPTRPDPSDQNPSTRPDPVGQSPSDRPGPAAQAPSTQPDPAGQALSTRPGPAAQDPSTRHDAVHQTASTWSDTAGQAPSTRAGVGGQAASVQPDSQAAVPVEDDFVPANEVERDLLHAVDEGSTDSFLSTLLLASVHVPVADTSRPGSAPGESGFAFRTERFDDEVFLVVFTSRDRLGEHFAEPTRTVGVRFVDLIRNWPDPAWSFAVNPTSPIGAKYPGPQVIALAAWAVEAGLGGDPVDAPAEQPQRPAEPTAQLTVMQKAVPAEQIDYYLERGYDRVAGFVHRAGEVEHLRSPGELFAALGLLYDGSPYQGDAKEAFVLRWPAHRPSLYRIPYGGQSEQALRAMDGWVIERPPFRGNGFAPGEGKDVIAEFKVDSVRLPHGAQLWRMDADGNEQMIAVFDCDAPVWRRVGEQ